MENKEHLNVADSLTKKIDYWSEKLKLYGIDDTDDAVAGDVAAADSDSDTDSDTDNAANVSDDLAYNFANELFDYCKNNSTMLWTRDDYVVFRLRELFKIENINTIKKIILRGSKDIATTESDLNEYIDMCKDIIEIKREIMYVYDEDANSIDYYLFTFIDELCEKYGKSHQLSISNIINVPACNKIAREMANPKPE
jgi:hypothetical protein